MLITRERLEDECSRNTLPLPLTRVRRMHNMSCDELVDFVMTKLMTDDKLSVDLLDDHDREELELHYGETVTIPNVEIFPTGTWNGDRYTPADLEGMVEAAQHVGFEPPIKLGHSKQQKLLADAGMVEDGMPAAGRIAPSSLKAVGGKLLATFKKVPAKIAQLIKDGAYYGRSAEVTWNYRDLNGRIWPRVLRAVSLLGEQIPAAKGMPALDTYVQMYGEDDAGELHYAGVEFERTTDMSEPNLEALEKKYEELAGTMADLKVANEKLATENEGLRTDVTTTQVTARAEETAFFCERMSVAGKLAPAEIPLVKTLLTELSKPEHNTATLKYSEGESEVEGSPIALLKTFIEKRPDAFKTVSTDRTSPGTPAGKSGKSTYYAEKEFHQATYDKVYAESIKAGKNTDEAHKLAKVAGLKGGDK